MLRSGPCTACTASTAVTAGLHAPCRGTPERDGGSVLTDVSALMRRLGLDSEAAVGASVGTERTEDPMSYSETHDTMRSGTTGLSEYGEGGSQLTASFASTHATESPGGGA